MNTQQSKLVSHTSTSANNRAKVHINDAIVESDRIRIQQVPNARNRLLGSPYMLELPICTASRIVTQKDESDKSKKASESSQTGESSGSNDADAPGDPGKYKEAGDPSDEARTPGEPACSEDPGEPCDNAGHGDLGEHGKPGEQDETGKLAEPGAANTPGEEGECSDSNKPGEAGRPSEPEAPGGLGERNADANELFERDSGQLGDEICTSWESTQPSEPGEPSDPGNTGEPGESGACDEFKKSGNRSITNPSSESTSSHRSPKGSSASLC